MTEQNQKQLGNTLWSIADSNSKHQHRHWPACQSVLLHRHTRVHSGAEEVQETG